MATTEDVSALWRIALAAALAVTLVRVAVLVVSPLQLYPDEAQYWWWAQTPARLFLEAAAHRLDHRGDHGAVRQCRMGDPPRRRRCCTAALRLLVFGIARKGFPKSPRTAFWSALAYLTLPGISYSSGLISTDAPLLFFWALALFAFLRAMCDEAALALGVLCGAGDRVRPLGQIRDALFLRSARLLAVVRCAASARRLDFQPRAGPWRSWADRAPPSCRPTSLWNAAHGFPTVAHTETATPAGAIARFIRCISLDSRPGSSAFSGRS
jgi:hypothetical protein